MSSVGFFPLHNMPFYHVTPQFENYEQHPVILSTNYVYCLQVCHPVLLQLHLPQLLSTTFCTTCCPLSTTYHFHLFHFTHDFLSLQYSTFLSDYMHHHTLPQNLTSSMKWLPCLCSLLNSYTLHVASTYMMLEIISTFYYFLESENKNQRSLVMKHNSLIEFIQNKARF